MLAILFSVLASRAVVCTIVAFGILFIGPAVDVGPTMFANAAVLNGDIFLSNED